MTSTEHVLSTTPFVVRRRVKWGDCDPAGVVYTVTFGEYVISAVELFYGMLFGSTPQRIKDEFGFGTPSRALSFDFRTSLWPDDEIDIRVAVEDIRTQTYVLDLTATTATGQIAFVSRLTPICVPRGERRAIPVPDVLRDALTSYQAACGAAATAGSLAS
ncbi:thioesterase family protein [Pigmentiphaga sp.]|uniref:acyl-CoA thioesterase n=1 Tax=Pigmentiphaga sp. TaxID=1977564 RepID=UPI00128B92DA|nr:thioesterase family protein [Pigmentiphaga sp.]MPS27096.1 thioesterase [Alcaligenaceae bacterium SAGV5]MPS51771.1 thioesterase [Alcaligenaceae bacterium SAGV3]MPT55185.1 thioesterase [Alcaligenaceae bacterium]